MLTSGNYEQGRRFFCRVQHAYMIMQLKTPTGHVSVVVCMASILPSILNLFDLILFQRKFLYFTYTVDFKPCTT